MNNTEKIIKAWERCNICSPSPIASPEAHKAYLDCEYTIGVYCGQDKLIFETAALLKEQQAMLNKACETLANMDFEFFCDDLMCDDGWCEEHCETKGTKPECIERWLIKQIKE